MTYDDVNNFLMQGGTPAVKFPDIGATVIGMITKPPKMRQVTDPATGEVKRWQSGDPQMQIVIDLQTELRDPTDPNDNGERTLWCKGLMMNAVRDAVRRSGAKGLEVGGVIQVTYTGDGEPTKKGFRGPKLYAANYTPAQAAPVAIPDSPGHEPPRTQQAPVQQAPVQSQVAARPVSPAPDPAVAQSFMDRLRQQAANNQAARAQQQGAQGQFQMRSPRSDEDRGHVRRQRDDEKPGVHLYVGGYADHAGQDGNISMVDGLDEDHRKVLAFTAAHCESIVRYA